MCLGDDAFAYFCKGLTRLCTLNGLSVRSIII